MKINLRTSDKPHRHQQYGANSIDYYAYTSKLKSWNPTYKVIFAFLVLLICIGMNHSGVSLVVVFSMAYLTICMGGLSLRKYLSLLSMPLAFMVMGSVAIAVGISTHSAEGYVLKLPGFYLYTSAESLLTASKVMLKALGAISAMYMMTLSTSVGEIIGVLRKLHLPKIIIELMNMIYRFIFILLDITCKMQHAAKSRLGYVDFKTAIYSFGNMGSSLLIASLKKANAYYDAMEARGYTGELLFLEEEKAVKKKHIIWASLYLVALIIIGCQ